MIVYAECTRCHPKQPLDELTELAGEITTPNSRCNKWWRKTLGLKEPTSPGAGTCPEQNLPHGRPSKPALVHVPAQRNLFSSVAEDAQMRMLLQIAEDVLELKAQQAAFVDLGVKGNAEDADEPPKGAQREIRPGSRSRCISTSIPCGRRGADAPPDAPSRAEVQQSLAEAHSLLI